MPAAEQPHAPHVMGERTLVLVWAGLVCLTALTIAVARIDLGFYNVLAALGIASTKALLVILFFMHMRYENRLLRWLLCLACLLLAIFIGMTFFDVAFRGVA